jgi:hypothetical protein
MFPFSFMNDLKFAFRQLLKNPGFTAVAIFTLESDGRIHDGFLSRTKSNHLPAATQRRGNSGLLALTKHVAHFGAAPDAGLDERDRLETSDRQHAPLFEHRSAVPGRASRNPVCRAKSRVAVKLRVRCLRESRLITPIFVLDLIEQCAQSRSRTRIPNDAFPCRVAIQLREQGRQTRREFFSFLGREILDRRFDFRHCAHGAKLLHRGNHGKPASQTRMFRFQLLYRFTADSFDEI